MLTWPARLWLGPLGSAGPAPASTLGPRRSQRPSASTHVPFLQPLPRTVTENACHLQELSQVCGSEVTSACRQLAGGGPSSPTSRTVRFTAWGVCAGGGRSPPGQSRRPAPRPRETLPWRCPGWGPHAHARGAHTALKPVPLTCTGRGVAASVTRPDATQSHTCAECTPHCQPPPVTETDLTPERGREPSLPAAGPPGAGRRSPWPGEGVVAAFAQDFLALGSGLAEQGRGVRAVPGCVRVPSPAPPLSCACPASGPCSQMLGPRTRAL